LFRILCDSGDPYFFFPFRPGRSLSISPPFVLLSRFDQRRRPFDKELVLTLRLSENLSPFPLPKSRLTILFSPSNTGLRFPPFPSVFSSLPPSRPPRRLIYPPLLSDSPFFLIFPTFPPPFLHVRVRFVPSPPGPPLSPITLLWRSFGLIVFLNPPFLPRFLEAYPTDRWDSFSELRATGAGPSPFPVKPDFPYPPPTKNFRLRLFSFFSLLQPVPCPQDVLLPWFL